LHLIGTTHKILWPGSLERGKGGNKVQYLENSNVGHVACSSEDSNV
jgi:hypothetical protein